MLLALIHHNASQIQSVLYSADYQIEDTVKITGGFQQLVTNMWE